MSNLYKTKYRYSINYSLCVELQLPTLFDSCSHINEFYSLQFLSMKLASISPLLHDFDINLDELSMNIQADNQVLNETFFLENIAEYDQ